MRRAGFGEGLAAGEALFDAILSSPSGVVITEDDHDEAWRRVATDDGRIHLALPDLLAELAGLADETPPGADPEWPFVLSAGERRAFSANTIFRDPEWRKRDVSGLRVSPADAARLGLADGGRARLTTRRGVRPRSRWSCTTASSTGTCRCPTAWASTTPTATGARSWPGWRRTS